MFSMVHFFLFIPTSTLLRLFTSIYKLFIDITFFMIYWVWHSSYRSAFMSVPEMNMPIVAHVNNDILFLRTVVWMKSEIFIKWSNFSTQLYIRLKFKSYFLSTISTSLMWICHPFYDWVSQDFISRKSSIIKTEKLSEENIADTDWTTFQKSTNWCYWK